MPVNHLSWLLLQSLEGILLTPINLWFWMAGVILALAAFTPRRRTSRPRSLTIAMVKLATPFLIPVAIVFGEPPSTPCWKVRRSILGLFALQVLTALGLMERHRARIDMAWFLLLPAIAWAASACFIALMAVRNGWL